MTANDASPTVLISEESLEERMNWRWSERDFDADATDEQQVEQGRMPDAVDAGTFNELRDARQTSMPRSPTERLADAFLPLTPHNTEPFGQLSNKDHFRNGSIDRAPSSPSQLPACQAAHWPALDMPTVSPSSLHAPLGPSSLGLTWLAGVPEDSGDWGPRTYRPSLAPLPRPFHSPPFYGPSHGDWHPHHFSFDPPHIFGSPSSQRPPVPYSLPPGENFGNEGAGGPSWRPVSGESSYAPRPPPPPVHMPAPYFLSSPHPNFDMLPPPPSPYGKSMPFESPQVFPSPTSPFLPHPSSTYRLPRPAVNWPRAPPLPPDLRTTRSLQSVTRGPERQGTASPGWQLPSQQPTSAMPPDEGSGRPIYTPASNVQPSIGHVSSPPAPTPSPSEHHMLDPLNHLPVRDEELHTPHCSDSQFGLTPPPTHPPQEREMRTASAGALSLPPGRRPSDEQLSLHPAADESRSRSVSPDAVPTAIINDTWSDSHRRDGSMQHAESESTSMSLSTKSDAGQPLPSVHDSSGLATRSNSGKKRLEPPESALSSVVKKSKAAPNSSDETPRRRRRLQCKNACLRCQRLHKSCDSNGKRPCAKCVKNLGLAVATRECRDSSRVDVGRRRSQQGQDVMRSDEAVDDGLFCASSDLSSLDGSSSTTSRSSSPALDERADPLYTLSSAKSGRPLRPRVDAAARDATFYPAPTHAYKTRANRGQPL